MASKELGVMTSEAKEELHVLIGSGLQVLNVPEDCVCSNCGMLAVFHFTNSCLHLYCRSCYLTLKLEKRICRKCRTPIGGKTVKNDSLDLVIANLKAECTNKNLGCNDVISLRDLLEHTENCEFSEMRLGTDEYSKRTIEDLENIFDSKLQKLSNEFSTKLEEATKALKKQFETTTNMISEKLSEVLKFCEKNDTNVQQRLETVQASLLNLQRNISGGNRRTEQLEKFVTDHEKNLVSLQSGQLKETCDKLDAALRNIETVDTVFLQRADWFSDELNKRNETVDELTAAVDEMKITVTKLILEKRIISENLTGVERTLATVQEKIDSPVDFLSKRDFTHFQRMQAQHMICTIDRLRGPNNGTFIWKIDEFSKKRKLKSPLCSGYFYSNEYGYRMRVRLQFNHTHIGVHEYFEPSAQEKHLPPIFPHKWTHFILDQSDRQEKIHISRTYEPHFRDGRCEKFMKGISGFAEICSYELLESVYLKNDEILVKIVVDPALDCTLDPLSWDGMLTWQVSKYQKIKQESRDEICSEVWSDSFYSSEFGYRMRACLEFTGYRLRVGLKMLVGQFDDSLPDIFAHKVTFSILDQSDRNGGNSLSREEMLDPEEIGEENAKEKMSIDEHCHSVGFPMCDFEKIPFLVDDSILIRVVVEPI